MPIMEWIPEMSVGVEEIDAQHKKMFDIINDLHAAMKNNNGHQVAGEIIQRLEKYTLEHFEFEEIYFKKSAYPEAHDHIRNHSELKMKISLLKNEVDQKGNLFALKLLHFLMDWIRDHIMQKDKSYVRYI